MVIRPFAGIQHVPQLNNLSIITCEYGLQDIDTVVIDRTFDFWKERKSTIDYPICPGDDYEWSTIEFREWKATRDPCFIIDLSVPDPLDLHLLVNILREYTLEFKVRVKSTLRGSSDYLIEAIRDRDC